MTSTPHFELLSGATLDAANAVYESIGFLTSDPSSSSTFGVLEDGQPIALARRQTHADGAIEIGGVWVREDHRGTGLARAAVQHVVDSLAVDEEAWCLAYWHLRHFYRSMDLLPVSQDDVLPRSIREKLDWCWREGNKGRPAPIQLFFCCGAE